MNTPRADVPHLLTIAAYNTASHQARLIGQIALETGNALPAVVTPGTVPLDAAALRGIPLNIIGIPGRGGAIPGTRPTDAIR